LVSTAEVERRAGGTSRITYERQLDARCSECPADFDNAGAAASHVRSARHTVIASYASRFLLVPDEKRAGP
jgi:hypothetical protein